MKFHLKEHLILIISVDIVSMSAKVVKPHRNLANRVGSLFPFARIRRWTDRLGLNKDPQQVIDKCNEELLALNKKNGPIKPTAPAKLAEPLEGTPLNQVESSKTEYNNSLLVYKSAWTTWKEYTSPEYAYAAKVFTFYKNMKRLIELLRREEQTPVSTAERISLLDILHDKPAHRGRRESDEDYKARGDKFVAPGYLELLDLFTNLEDANAIDQGLNNLRSTNLYMENFLCKEEASHEKTRFNDTGLIAISAGSEAIAAECARYAMKNVLSDGKKIIQPDHVLNGIKESPLYPLFSCLPHFQNLVARSKRREMHDASNKLKRQNLFKEARKRAQDDGRQYRKEDSPDTSSLKSFEDEEVELGNAIKQAISPGKKSRSTEPRFTYLWHGVEYDEGELDSTNFDYYVGALAKSIKDSEFATQKDADGIKVSKHIKQFLSKLITDFLARLAPMFRILIEYDRVKTVEGNTVLAAYKMMLCDGYKSRNGNVVWSNSHQSLFDEIQTRIDTWKTMSVSAKALAEQEPDVTDMTDAIVDPLEDDTVAVPAPAPSVVSRSQVVRRR